MKDKEKHIEMIKIISKALEHLNHQVVFVGGIVIGLYIDEYEDPDLRPTDDVDCIIELGKLIDYHKLELELRKLGFVHCIDKEQSVICRWKYSGIIVDIMPRIHKFLVFQINGINRD